ncbi:hypothetical protein IJI94_02520 [Candidatus Saccharibacteria bacterium]|nr:hypothetical protein [Candidatus Saccharibacteria bacterium]
MADFIFIRKSRNAFSSFLHVLLNILLGAGSIFVTIVSSPILGIILVLISKWRIFAVRPRYWLTNIQSSLIDFIVGISLVLAAYFAGTEFSAIHVILAVIYVIWLLFIKPMSSEIGTLIQSLFAIFLGSNIASIALATVNPVFIILAEFVIGYSASRHILIQNQREKSTFITLICGLVFAEISWLCNHWMIIYNFPLNIAISQTAVILTILAFFFDRTYVSIEKHDGKLKAADVLVPTIFSILVIIIIILNFSDPRFNIHI